MANEGHTAMFGDARCAADEISYSQEKVTAEKEWDLLKRNINDYVANTLASGQNGIVIRGQCDERTEETITEVLGEHLGGLVIGFLKKIEAYEGMFYTVGWSDILDYIIDACGAQAALLSPGKEIYCINSDYLMDSDAVSNICYTSSPAFLAQYLSEVYSNLQICLKAFGDEDDSVYYNIIKEHICPAYISSEQRPALPFLAAYLLALDQVPLVFKYVGDGYLVDINLSAKKLLVEFAALRAEISEDGELRRNGF